MAEIKIKGDISGSTTIKAPDSGSDEIIELSTVLDGKAPLDSPTFTGTVILPTTTQIGGGTGLGSWTAYTPTWTSSGTAPAIGNGTLAGRYVQIGKLVVFRMFWKAGSTTTFGTGTYYWSLPVSRSTSGGFATPVINGHMNDNSLNKYAHVFSVFQPTATEFALASAGDAGTTSAIGQTTPITWANLDFILITGTYEAA